MPNLPENPSNLLQKNVEIRSEPVQEILTYVPHWLVHSGSTAVLVALVFLLTGSYFIKYPDTIHAPLVLTTGKPPLRLIAMTSGNIQKLFVQDRDPVSKADYLAILESSAELEDILWLRDKFTDIESFLRQPRKVVPDLDRNLQIGDLQAPFARFYTNYTNYHHFLNENYPHRLMASIQSQIANYQELESRLKRRHELNQEELSLMQKTYERHRDLFEKKLIAKEQYQKSYAAYLAKQQDVTNSENSILTNRIQITEYRKTMLELEQSFAEKSREALVVLQEDFKQLQSAFATWERQYVLKAPAEGTVAFHKYWGPNQYVEAGEEVLTIVPREGGMLGKINLPQEGFGKVALGQEVQIRFDSYPYKEYGLVLGVVAAISPVAREDEYLVTVHLSQGLTTTYGKRLTYKFEMIGDATIVTEELRLIQRIFSEFRFFWSSYT